MNSSEEDNFTENDEAESEEDNFFENEESGSLIQDDKDNTILEKKIGQRHIFALCSFLGFANVYAMRVNLSVAIVAMVNSSAIPSDNTNTSDVCPLSDYNSTTPTKEGEFNWNEAEQGMVLGSFFWGYMLTNLIGGRLAEVVGGKKVFIGGIFITSLLTLFLPNAAKLSFPLVVIMRVLIGLGEGVTFPSMNCLMAKWIPPLERSQMASLIFGGCQFGTVISLPISGLLCQYSLDGWPSVFYLFGSLGLLWCIFGIFFIHESPHSHPWISREEKQYISRSLNLRKYQGVLPVPYLHILKSSPFWAILVVHVAQNWGFYFLLTELPTYLNNILHFNIRSNSFLSALPYLAMWIFSLSMGHLADFLRRRGYLSTTAARRIFNSIGIYVPMICLILVGYSGCNWKLSICLLILAVGFNGAISGGYMCSHLDIASNYAGTLLGMTNCAATIPGFVAPVVVGSLINGNETLTQWRLAFWIAAIIYFIGNTFFVIFITGEEQSWNRIYENESDDRSINSSEDR